MSRRPRLLRWPLLLVPAGAATAVAAVGLVAFQPWKLWVDHTVNEALPAATVTTGPSSTPDPDPTPAATPAATPAVTPDPAPVVLAGGTLISHEHDTSGSVRIIRLPDGSRVLRLEDLETSNGPDLRVWLTDAPVLAGRDGWHVFDDGAHVSLGKLKGNRGNQNYALPADLDLDRYVSVTIWCDRFNVSFGAARVTATQT